MKVNRGIRPEQAVEQDSIKQQNRPRIMQNINNYQAHTKLERLIRGDDFPPEHDNVDPMLSVDDTIHDNYDNPSPLPTPYPNPDPIPPIGPWGRNKV